MIHKIINNTTKSTIGAALILGAASFVSRLIGIIRDRIFAHQFGAGDILDAYYAAFRIPDLVYNLLIIGALSAGFIPVFMKLILKDKQEAWKVTSAVINILGLALIIICGILFLITPNLIKFIVPGFDAEKMQTTATLTRIMFLSPILLGISAVVSGVLQSLKSFFIYALTPIMYNVGIIIGAIILVPIFGTIGLAYGVILGAIFHLSIQLPTFFGHGFNYRAILLWKNKYVREIMRLMLPRTLGLATVQANLLIMTVLASTIGAGSIAIFNFANNLQYFPIGIIGISFAVAAFPVLAKFSAEERKEEMANHLSKTIRQILFFIIPLSILFILLRAQIVRVLLGTGKFDWTATKLTMDALAFFSISLFAQCLVPLLARGFYALHDTWKPFIAGLAGSMVNIILAINLKNTLGVSGLALAFSFGMIIQLIILWIWLRYELKSLQEMSIVQSLFKISAAAIPMALSVQLLKTPLSHIVNMTKFWGIMLQGLIAGLVGLLIYVLICYAIKLPEIIDFKNSLERRWMKLKNIQGEVGEADKI